MKFHCLREVFLMNPAHTNFSFYGLYLLPVPHDQHFNAYLVPFFITHNSALFTSIYNATINNVIFFINCFMFVEGLLSCSGEYALKTPGKYFLKLF